MTDLVSQLVGALEDMRGKVIELCQTYGNPLPHGSLERTDAALTAAKAGGWQDISTAPRDGSMFLCWVQAVRYGETDEGQQYQQDASEVDFCRWCACDESPNGGYFDNMAGQIADLQYVTKWQPLPTPPKEQSAGGLGPLDDGA